MALELIFPIVALALFAIVVWLSALGAPGGAGLGERRAHLRLIWPLFAGALPIAFLVGWVIQEDEPADEYASAGMCILAAFAAAVLGRALVRGGLSLYRSARPSVPIATVGLFRCRTVVSAEFRAAAGPEVLAAALGHEGAHARARDPLRIWLAQLGADIQWPIPGAHRRLKDWLRELELVRDDDAIASGASPTALAESILLAARLEQGQPGMAGASVAGDGSGLEVRVRRLLSAEAGGTTPRSSRLERVVRLACLVAIPAVVWLGVKYGDPVLALLPGVGR